MKLTRYRGVLFAVAAITAVLSSCSSSTSEAKKEVSPFVGNWMRVGDGLEGLIIEIKEKDSTFTGFVVDAPVNVKDLFPVGEEKWLELKQDDSTKVTGELYPNWWTHLLPKYFYSWRVCSCPRKQERNMMLPLNGRRSA